MTIVEVMVALLVMTAAGQVLISTLTASVVHRATREEQALAVEAVMNVIEEMRAVPFYDLFAEFNSNPADDPGGLGTAHGSQFQVEGLDAQEGAAFVGRVLLPERAGQLVEGVAMEELGMPRDLNGDFLVDQNDHSDDYLILPVRVTVRWRGRNGDRSFTMATMLADLEKEQGS